LGHRKISNFLLGFFVHLPKLGYTLNREQIKNFWLREVGPENKTKILITKGDGAAKSKLKCREASVSLLLAVLYLPVADSIASVFSFGSANAAKILLAVSA